MSTVKSEKRKAAGMDTLEETESVGLKQGQLSLGLAFGRVILGIVVLLVWFENITDPATGNALGFYSGDGIIGFFDWAFTPAEEGGNGSSLGFVEAIIDATVLQAPGFFGAAQAFVEFFIGLFLVLGVFTRGISVLALAFFVGLFFTFFGGEEWIGSYILLISGAVTVFLTFAGRHFGADRLIAAARGESPLTLLW